MDSSHYTGASSEALIVYKLLASNIDVFTPASFHSSCDMLALDGSKLMKIQVKTLSRIKSGNFYYLQTRLRYGPVSNGYQTHEKDTFTHLAVVFEGHSWMIPWELVWEKKSFSIGRCDDEGTLRFNSKWDRFKY